MQRSISIMDSTPVGTAMMSIFCTSDVIVIGSIGGEMVSPAPWMSVRVTAIASNIQDVARASPFTDADVITPSPV